MYILLKDIKKILFSIQDDIEKKKWLKAVLKSVLFIGSVVCMALFVLWLMGIIAQYLDYIIIIGGGVACSIALIRSMTPKNEIKQEQQVQEPKSNTILWYDPITLENTYKLLRAGLCYIVGEIAEVIATRKPTSYSQMDSPTHYDIIANVPIYHLLVAKSGGMESDTYTVMGILQNAIEQKLNNNEFNGISQAVFFYKGQAYPSIMVDKVRDCGNMLQIDIAIASEYYCKYREQRIYNDMNGTGSERNQDKDF